MPDSELLGALRGLTEVEKSKDDLYVYYALFNRFDAILDRHCEPETAEMIASYALPPDNDAALVVEVLRVSAMILENRVSKNLGEYNSVSSLSAMLSADSLEVVRGALEVLLALGRHRKKIEGQPEAELQQRLASLAQGWGLAEHGLGLVECCFDEAESFPLSTRRFNFEFFLSAADIQQRAAAVGAAKGAAAAATVSKLKPRLVGEASRAAFPNRFDFSLANFVLS